jgi:hypothetical protein
MKLAEHLVGVVHIAGRLYLPANCNAPGCNICQCTANSREVPQSLRFFGMTGASNLYFYYFYSMPSDHNYYEYFANRLIFTRKLIIIASF